MTRKKLIPRKKEIYGMKRGFSLIELLVVVAIIAILVGVAAPYYNDYVKESKRTKALQDIDVLKQAVLLHDSQEDLPYLGVLATATAQAARIPVLGENDFNGLQGKYLTNIPTDPWDKNYKLDPVGCFIYSEGPDSAIESDDVRDYYVKDLALVSVEWEDLNNDRLISDNDKLYFTFNKCLHITTFDAENDFDVFVNGLAVTGATSTLRVTAETITSPTTATTSVIVTRVNPGNTVKLGVHSLAIKDDVNVRKKYMEVWADRDTSNSTELKTRVIDINHSPAPGDPSNPLRFIIRSNPIKIKEKK